MIKASFYCNIYDADTKEIIEDDFCFDDIKVETHEELESYIRKSNYVKGKPCGYWGENVGILIDILIDEMY